MRAEDELLLIRHGSGDLTGEEARQAEKLLAVSDEHRAYAEELRRVSEAIHSQPLPAPSQDLVAAALGRHLQQAKGRVMPARRVWAIAASGALLLGAAYVGVRQYRDPPPGVPPADPVVLASHETLQRELIRLRGRLQRASQRSFAASSAEDRPTALERLKQMRSRLEQVRADLEGDAPEPEDRSETQTRRTA